MKTNRDEYDYAMASSLNRATSFFWNALGEPLQIREGFAMLSDNICRSLLRITFIF